MNFENPTPKNYDIPVFWGPTTILNPVFNMEYCKKMRRQVDDPNPKAPNRVAMGCTICLCNTEEFIKKRMLPASKKHPNRIVWYQIFSISNLYTINICLYSINSSTCFISSLLVHVHSQMATHTCKNCPMQAKVLVKSHRYLGTS